MCRSGFETTDVKWRTWTVNSVGFGSRIRYIFFWYSRHFFLFFRKKKAVGKKLIKSGGVLRLSSHSVYVYAWNHPLYIDELEYLTIKLRIGVSNKTLDYTILSDLKQNPPSVILQFVFWIFEVPSELHSWDTVLGTKWSDFYTFTHKCEGCELLRIDKVWIIIYNLRSTEIYSLNKCFSPREESNQTAIIK